MSYFVKRFAYKLLQKANLISYNLYEKVFPQVFKKIK